MTTAQKERIESPGGYIELLDVGKEKATNKTPLFLIFGWGETLAGVEKTIASFSSAGYRVLAADYDHLDAKKPSSDKYPQIEYIKALAVLTVVRKKKIDTIDIIAHSEGAISATIAALLSPKKIRNIIYISPASMAKEGSFFRLVPRFAGFLVRQLWQYPNSQKKLAFVYLKEIFMYVLRNPLQAIKQVLGIVATDIPHMAKLLKGKVVLHIIHSTRDGVFPVEGVQRAGARAGISNFYEIKGGHNVINTHPEKVINVIKAILR